MRTADATVDITPGSLVVHPPGELHEYANGPARTVLFRVRYGSDFSSRTKDWPSNPGWQARPEDAAFFAATG